MPTTRRTFHIGIMDKDTDERLLPNGTFRHAENVEIVNSEGSNEGAVENMLSNKKISDIYLGKNVHTVGGYEDVARKKLYWFTTSEYGCFLLEFDQKTGIISKVLSDTRPLNERVLNLKKDHSITGICKIIGLTDDKDLLIWTDNNIGICCINVERAKTYAFNSFSYEDIYLIKKYPNKSPETFLFNSNLLSNNIEDKFISFGYRYKYLDGEYSAISSLTNYKFAPKQYELDYETLENLGMINSYNSINITFNTGSKNVTDIQIIAKNSNSNTLYVVETFNKEKEGWGNNQDKYFNYSNNKLYTTLSDKELFRTFDNVPIKAKSLTLIKNRIAIGNYFEGHNLIDIDNKKIKIDFKPNLINNSIQSEQTLNTIISQDEKYIYVTPAENLELKKGYKIYFYFYITETNSNNVSFRDSIEYILPADYNSLQELYSDLIFQEFIVSVNNLFLSRYVISDVPSSWELLELPNINITTSNNNIKIHISPAKYRNTENNNIETIDFLFKNSTYISIYKISIATSLHSNRDIETALIYIDEFGRQTTAITCLTNSIHNPLKNSIYQNKIQLEIYNKPPKWAKQYKIALKTYPLSYQTIYISKYYVDDVFVWCKLEGDSKDKVKEGDVLILKKTPLQVQENVIKTKVLEIKYFDRDFILNNYNKDGIEIIEDRGVYMKIKPQGFVMSTNDVKTYKSSSANQNGAGKPSTAVPLFSKKNEDGSYTHLSIPNGAELKIYFKSYRKFDNGWRESIYNKTLYARRPYTDIKEWLDEVLLNKDIYTNEHNNEPNPHNLNGNIHIVKGHYTQYSHDNITLFNIEPNDNGAYYLVVVGFYQGNGQAVGKRYGRVDLSVELRISDGYFVFETEEQKKADLNLFYQSEETFDIIDNTHKGNVQNQESDLFIPAISEINFHNCYCFGNGVESYKIKDSFNGNFLNIDLKPTTTNIEEYKEIHRFADVTYSETFVDGTNINGLNEFNLSTANWKELNKEYGEINILHARDNNLLVGQRDKWGQVLFGKDILYNTDGTSNLTKVPYVLGEYIPYVGEYGISEPESFKVDTNRCYAVDKNKGIVLRLSNDGITPIVMGMKDWFRDVFFQNDKAKILGGIDPYHKKYQITIGEQPIIPLQIKCGNFISKSNITTPFYVEILLNDLNGQTNVFYEITQGIADVHISFAEKTYRYKDISGQGHFKFNRISLKDNIIKITIIPTQNEQPISFTIGSRCPKGNTLTIVSVVINDKIHNGKNISISHIWGGSNKHTQSVFLNNKNISLFKEEIGIEGTGKFPKQESNVFLSLNDPNYKEEYGCRLGYSITSEDFNQNNINNLLSQVEYLDLNFNNNSVSGNFIFQRNNTNQKLYLLWDYTSNSSDREKIIEKTHNQFKAYEIEIISNEDIVNGKTFVITNTPIDITKTDNGFKYLVVPFIFNGINEHIINGFIKDKKGYVNKFKVILK